MGLRLWLEFDVLLWLKLWLRLGFGEEAFFYDGFLYGALLYIAV